MLMFVKTLFAVSLWCWVKDADCFVWPSLNFKSNSTKRLRNMLSPFTNQFLFDSFIALLEFYKIWKCIKWRWQSNEMYTSNTYTQQKETKYKSTHGNHTLLIEITFQKWAKITVQWSFVSCFSFICLWCYCVWHTSKIFTSNNNWSQPSSSIYVLFARYICSVLLCIIFVCLFVWVLLILYSLIHAHFK